MEYMTDLGKRYNRHLSKDAWNWKTLDDFYVQLSTIGTAVNVAPLVGHSTLCANVEEALSVARKSGVSLEIFTHPNGWKIFDGLKHRQH